MKQSAGIILYKWQRSELLVLLVHPGGPFWKNKDLGSWSIPKGEFTSDENPLDAAIREFAEETGLSLNGDFIELEPVKIKSGKTIHAWAMERDYDTNTLISNTFDLEWPPKSGKLQPFPEVDRAEWFPIAEALEKISTGQVGLIEQLVSRILKG